MFLALALASIAHADPTFADASVSAESPSDGTCAISLELTSDDHLYVFDANAGSYSFSTIRWYLVDDGDPCQLADIGTVFYEISGDADVDAEVRNARGEGCGLDHAVHAAAGVEAHVVGSEDVIDARAPDALEECAAIGERAGRHFVVRVRADTERRTFAHRATSLVSSPSRSRPVSSRVAGPTIMCWVATWTSRKIRWSGERR